VQQVGIELLWKIIFNSFAIWIRPHMPLRANMHCVTCHKTRVFIICRVSVQSYTPNNVKYSLVTADCLLFPLNVTWINVAVGSPIVTHVKN